MSDDRQLGAEIDWDMVEFGLRTALRGVAERNSTAVHALLTVLLDQVPCPRCQGLSSAHCHKDES